MRLPPFADLRMATALGVCALCCFTVWRGVDVTRFALVEISSDHQTAAARLAPWFDTPGLGLSARRLAFERAPSGDAGADAAAVSNIIARAPLDSMAWATLSSLRFLSGARVGQGVEALAMSSLTGPNEGRVMAKRAFIALPRWRTLPPESRAAAVKDLIHGWAQMTEAQRQFLRDLLIAGDMREEIRTALLLAGAEAAPAMRSLRLDLPEGSP